jgi:hypothetical protein
MEFDIDTIGEPFTQNNSKVKVFPIWKSALKEAIINKKKINAQVKLSARFYYEETKDIKTDKFIGTVQKTVEAYKPLYDFLKGD